MNHRTEESLNSRFNDSMLNSSSALFRSDRTLARTMAGSAGRRLRLRNRHNGPPRLPRLRVRRTVELILGFELRACCRQEKRSE